MQTKMLYIIELNNKRYSLLYLGILPQLDTHDAFLLDIQGKIFVPVKIIQRSLFTGAAGPVKVMPLVLWRPKYSQLIKKNKREENESKIVEEIQKIGFTLYEEEVPGLVDKE